MQLIINGVQLVADPAGVLHWPERDLVAVADLHLEKGTAAHRRGVTLPPYDSIETLSRLGAVLRRLKPRTVIALGDSFHDRGAHRRLSAVASDALQALIDGHDWVWIAGNHDPDPPSERGGQVAEAITIGALTFRHEVARGAVGEVSGHYHPKAKVRARGCAVSGRCFAADGRRAILPAFGSYTGGLNVLDPAVARHFDRPFEVVVMGTARLFRFPESALVPAAA